MNKAACVLIEDDRTRRVLAVARKDDPTKFGLPGGKIDPADEARHVAAPKVAAIRELWEETGLDFREQPHVIVPFFVQFDEEGWLTYTFRLGLVNRLVRDTDLEPASQPGEGRCEWVTWDTLFEGPFGQYNRALYAKLATESLYLMF